jgi:lysophospholipase L1-like esterase
MKILGREWIASVLVVVVTLLLGTMALEVAMRFVIKPSSVMKRQLLIGLGVTDSDQNWEKDPDLGWMIKPSATFRNTNPFNEFDQVIRTDALGLRVPLDRATERPRAARNLLFVGDSQTASYEVGYEETFEYLVEKALGSSTRSLNAGIRGYSTEQTLKRMRALLEHKELGVTDVIYLYSGNDPFENMSLHFSKRLMSKPGAYLDSGGELRYRTLDYPVGVLDSEALFVAPGGEIATLPLIGLRRPVRWLKDTTKRTLLNEGNWLERSYVVGLVKLTWEIFTAPRSPDIVRQQFPYIDAHYIPDDSGGYAPGFVGVTWEPDSYPIRLLEVIVKHMKAEADRQGVRLWVVVPLGATLAEEQFFRNVASRYGIRLIDSLGNGFARQVVDRCGGTLVFKTDGHYTACAHAGQAEVIAAALKEASAE